MISDFQEDSKYPGLNLRMCKNVWAVEIFVNKKTINFKDYIVDEINHTSFQSQLNSNEMASTKLKEGIDKFL